VSALAAASCSSDPAANGEPYAAVLEDRIVLRTGDFEIAPGDVFECFYTPLTAESDILVSHGVGAQMEGGHHITVYYTMAPQDVGHHPCTDDEMTSWRQVAAAEGLGDEEQFHVPGLATRIPAGAQIVLQAHYINLSGPRVVNDHVDVLIPRPEEVQAMAGTMIVIDDTFEVPPRTHLRRVMTCTVPRDVQVAFLLGHMHEWGSHYRLERLDGSGGSEMLYDAPWEASYASHPPYELYGLETPMLVPAGTQLRQTCEWDNAEVDPLLFPREMCLAYMITFPAVTDDLEFCEVDTVTEEILP